MPYNYEENIKREDTCWCFDENQGLWKPVSRESSFTDNNRFALSENSVNTTNYTKEFRRHVKNEEKKLRSQSRNRNVVTAVLSWIWRQTFGRMGEDWICLALLGVFMALLSVSVDKGIEWCSNGNFPFNAVTEEYESNLGFQVETGCTEI